MKTMLNWAVRNRLCTENPIGMVESLPKRKVRNRRALTDEEMESLLAASKPEEALIWRTFLSTAMRRGELASLKWRDVDFENGMINLKLENVKTYCSRSVPITQGLLADLLSLKNGSRSEYVFVNSAGSPWRDNLLLKHLRRCLKRAGISSDGVDLHAFLYTTATHMIRNGADVKTVQDFIGHKTIRMTLEVYAQVFPHGKRKALDYLPAALK